MADHINRHYPISILYALALVCLSLYPFGEIEMAKDVPLADKWTHMVMYGGFSLCLWMENRRRNKDSSHRKLVLRALLLPILFGGAMELAQKYLTETRSGEWFDFLANSIGAAVAFLCCLLCPPRKRRK